MEISLVASYHRYDVLNVFLNFLFKHNCTEITSVLLVLVVSVCGADEKVLPFLKVVGGRIVELIFAICAENQTVEHIALTDCCSAMTLLSDIPNPLAISKKLATHRWCWMSTVPCFSVGCSIGHFCFFCRCWQ